MIVPNRDPSRSAGPEHPETDHLDLLLALDFLHEFHDKALANDAATMDHRMSVLSDAARLETRSFLQLCVPDEQNSPMTSAYERMVLRPEVGTTSRNKVREIIARFPYFAEHEQPFEMPEGVTKWNDVSLEMTFIDGTSSRYLLNSKGIFPYTNAQAIYFDYPRSPDSADLYVVQSDGHDENAGVLSGGELRVLLRQSQAMTQADNPEDE